MKTKTTTKHTEAKPSPLAAAPAAQPVFEAREPSEHVMLARIMARASQAERALIYQLLEDCTVWCGPITEAVLCAPSHALGLGLHVETIAEFAGDFRALSWLTIFSDEWLYKFLHEIFEYVNKREDLRPEDIMDMAETHLLELDAQLEVAKKIIKDHPELVGDQIREAIAARPALLA